MLVAPTLAPDALAPANTCTLCEMPESALLRLMVTLPAGALSELGENLMLAAVSSSVVLAGGGGGGGGGGAVVDVEIGAGVFAGAGGCVG